MAEEYDDSSGEGFVDGVPDFLKALSEDATEEAAADLHEELIALNHVSVVAMRFVSCDKLLRSGRHPEARPAFRPIAWPRYI